MEYLWNAAQSNPSQPRTCPEAKEECPQLDHLVTYSTDVY